ncbi:unnamed protein product [Trypanosoma congolense IL3000]|uniref:WGS project CAEQ00000000 data, annotated contig 1746 n=1 Tax=Trypanosoma congolense (strain IL3000) TaxID=1068625 RepID=F9W8L9_TRYCI|nr:unnamed protein product [Trypanosoma congolense IL3000]
MILWHGPSSTWTLCSRIRDVLMEDCCGLCDMSLRDFLMPHFGRMVGYLTASMSAFIGSPSIFLKVESLRTLVTSSPPYREFVREYELHKTLREGDYRQRAMGVINIRHCDSAAATTDEVEGVGACVRGVLNVALDIANGIGDAPTDEESDGMYDAVFNAEWRYVARSDEYSRKWLMVSVLGMAPGEQPHLWSGVQADVRPEHKEPWEGDVVPCVKVKLVMAFLSSLKGWPCGLFQRNEVPDVSTLTEYDVTCDAYIRKEYLRVWHIVKEGLDQWMESGRVVLPLIVIGTPGIGKSFATVSLLLYQLLHYTLERLEVVAYVVEGKAYISYREERRVVH